jgi:hypothetical protein
VNIFPANHAKQAFWNFHIFMDFRPIKKALLPKIVFRILSLAEQCFYTKTNKLDSREILRKIEVALEAATQQILIGAVAGIVSQRSSSCRVF